LIPVPAPTIFSTPTFGSFALFPRWSVSCCFPFFDFPSRQLGRLYLPSEPVLFACCFWGGLPSPAFAAVWGLYLPGWIYNDIPVLPLTPVSPGTFFGAPPRFSLPSAEPPPPRLVKGGFFLCKSVALSSSVCVEFFPDEFLPRYIALRFSNSLFSSFSYATHSKRRCNLVVFLEL